MSVEPTPSRRLPEWTWIGLIAILVFDVWWRAHTFAPTLVEPKYSLPKLWPVVVGRTEPLDCDEAAYGYIGRRLLDGAVMYRDLTENKPPLGYWAYALAIRLGRADELTIRLMPIPPVLATIAMVWWLGLRVAGPAAGCLAAFLYALLSTDPYVFGNGANLEHLQNLLAVASLVAMVEGWRSRCMPPAWFGLAGLLLGAACLVKQVEVTHGLVYVGAIALRPGDQGRRSIGERLADLAALAAGFAIAWAAAVGVLFGQGAGPFAYEDIVLYGKALATDTPPPPNAPPFPLRWFVGNSDPRTGALPWPFGRTDWLVWWGTGSWPSWLAAVPGVIWMIAGRGASGPRRLVAAWTLSTWIQVALPGLFWQHYYLLPTPGVALAVAVLATAAARLASSSWRGRRKVAALGWSLVATAAVASTGGTLALQTKDYLFVPPELLTVKYKGGAQWVRLRDIGEELARRSALWKGPQIYVWGWQSPLYYYSGLDSPSRHFFANELLKAYAGKEPPHPLVGPWIDEILETLHADPPEIIFTGDPPFPELRSMLVSDYRTSSLVPEGPVLWVERRAQRAFDRWNWHGVPRPEPLPGPEGGLDH